MTDSEKIEFLQGQVQCLAACCYVLITMHSEPSMLHKALDKALETALAKASGEPFEEALIEGIHDLKQRLMDVAGVRGQQHLSNPIKRE